MKEIKNNYTKGNNMAKVGDRITVHRDGREAVITGIDDRGGVTKFFECDYVNSSERDCLASYDFKVTEWGFPLVPSFNGSFLKYIIKNNKIYECQVLTCDKDMDKMGKYIDSHMASNSDAEFISLYNKDLGGDGKISVQKKYVYNSIDDMLIKFKE